MNILFCCEGFIVDGVTSYNLYMSAALQRAGHTVAVVGRWGGLKGFQKRHRTHGVTVLERFSLTVASKGLLRDAVEFRPDIIITDSRRSFPFAQQIKRHTGAQLVTVFHDPPQLTRKGNRGIEAIIAASDFWLTSEKPIHDALEQLHTGIPTLLLQRPITAMVEATPLVPKDPFRVLCLGRLSGWKSPAIKYLVRNAPQLCEAIPGLEIYVVGGGRRIVNFKLAALWANLQIKRRAVHILGTRVDPNPWFNKATIVCAGATSAIEAILSNRPVVAVSGVWMGPVTTQNVQYGLDSHFAERDGEVYTKINPELIYLQDRPEIIGDSLVELYNNWNHEKMVNQANELQQFLSEKFDSMSIAQRFSAFVEHNQHGA